MIILAVAMMRTRTGPW